MPTGDARLGLKAVGLWTLVEFAIRVGMVVAAGGGFVLLSGQPPRNSDVGPLLGLAVAVPLLLAILTLAVIFRRRAKREGLGLRELGYEFSRRRTLVGVVSGLVLLLAAWVTVHIDLALFPHLAILAESLMRVLAEGGPVVTAIMLVANGVLGPIVEEFAWRGYIQYRLTRAWGTWAGLAATAVLFTAKHSVVDLSIARTTTLVIGSFGLGFMRQRWGTLASTLAHVTLNLLSTIYLYVMVSRD